MEPPFYFVRDKTSHAAHHWDYLRNRRATALCGHDYDDIHWEGSVRPTKVCRSCQEVLPRFEAKWWRKEARRAEVHRDRLEEANKRLDGEVRALKRQMNQLTYQLELSKSTIESQKATIEAQGQKINNQRITLHRLQTAKASAKKATQKSVDQPPVRSIGKSKP
jgi:membrane-associated HD superfamily phosphohydrolase